MLPTRRPWAIRPFTAVLLSTLPVALLVRCALVPTFPPRDAQVFPTDSGLSDAMNPFDSGDARGIDAPLEADVGGDVPRDMGVDATPNGGFRTCGRPMPLAMLTVTPFTATGSGIRDLAFDGHTQLATVSAGVFVTVADGTTNMLAVTPSFSGGVAARFAGDGHLIATTGAAGAASLLDIDIGAGTAVSISGPSLSFPASIAIHPSGTIFVADTLADAVLSVRRDGTNATTFARAGLHPAGITLTPDARYLYVGTPGMTGTSSVYEVMLAPDGTPVGTPRVYASDLFTATGIAFDECGYLYVADKDRNRLLRFAPGGATAEALVLVSSTDGGTVTPSGIAFGRGTGFDPQDLYIADAVHNVIVRVTVGVNGAAIVGP